MSNLPEWPLAKVCIEDGTWQLMLGPVRWMGEGDHYFIHHSCSLDEMPRWQTWYTPLDKESHQRWCRYCESEPPEALLGMFKMMVLL